MEPTTLVYLIRHGESAGNANPTLSRREDPPLTERGRMQAASAARALSGAGIGGVCSSPLRRARETAEPLAGAIGVEIRIVPSFGEVDMGTLSDPRTPEERADRDAILQAWLAGDHRRAYPGGERWRDVVQRVAEGLTAIAAAAPSHAIAVVSHRVAIAAAGSLAAGDSAPPPRGACANGSITTLRRAGGGGWELVSWGDARHLPER